MSRPLLDAAGPASPPRDNGELVFEAPWESRSFGIAVALGDAGTLDVEEFRARLIEEIRSWQAAHPGTTEGWAYYERWQAALERALVERGVVTPAEIAERARALAHEQAHDHEHREG